MLSRAILRPRRLAASFTPSSRALKTFAGPAHGRHRLIALQFASSGNLLIVAVSIVLAGGVGLVYNNQSPGVNDSQHAGTQDLQLDEAAAMAAGTPLPGRPGNLTAEQEEKLKEFWVALFNVFGLPDSEKEHTAGDVRPASQKVAEHPEAAKAKKKGGFFSSSKSHNDPSVHTDPEDKYGQNKEFQKIMETVSPEDLRQAFWSMVKADNPDALALRFLRARKWNVQNGLAMLIATIHWRLSEIKVDSDIIKRGEGGALEDSESSDASKKKEGHDFLQQFRMGKSFLHGTDKEGRPICLVRVKLHRAGEQTDSSQERFTVYTIETARLLLHDNVDTAAILFDMTDFSMANMDYTPVKFIIKVFEANYPESLGVVLVHKSPWIFQSIWRIIKGWLDPVVAAKVHFTKNVEELSHFIPLEHISKDMGGKEAYSYSYVPPVKGENAQLEKAGVRDELLKKRADLVKDYEGTTQKWLHGDKTSEAKRKELTESLRTGYWELDPYLRAKTLYDRTGVINPGGKIDFYPSASSTNGGPTPAGHVDDGVD